MRVLLVAHNELAIVTKSIAFALSPATRSPWVPSRSRRGGTVIGKTHEERGNCNLVVIWWEKIPEGKEGVNLI